MLPYMLVTGPFCKVAPVAGSGGLPPFRRLISFKRSCLEWVALA